MNEIATKAISELHHQLEAMEAWVTSEPAIVTGVKGVRIMRLVALISGDAFRYVLVRTGSKGRWC
ncbi:hypothetical protein EVC45_38935 [Paraburkholderia sp. UYCP14C]|uniref:hypothetical protein n=1 Tax=Paraburkholderia sp. UYCP14C TaxID=2511130 RepID=UPI0010211C0C|nr:hypothetical protein [Paraburkholderia sp. UYCP14C]RZF24402.1 hypothetical protein EVC45_38935 [Paraburkholderia sp. UYCP14C]